MGSYDLKSCEPDMARGSWGYLYRTFVPLRTDDSGGNRQRGYLRH